MWSAWPIWPCPIASLRLFERQGCAVGDDAFGATKTACLRF
jgi:hypothetical protein